MGRRSAAIGCVAGLLTVGLAGCAKVPGVYVYENADQKSAAAATGGGGATKFDPKQFVEANWASKVMPTVTKDAVPLGELLTAIGKDQAGASKQYGNQAGTGSPYAFLTKGTGTVTAYDKDAPTHPITVKVDGVPGASTVQIVTGPVIAGTALRDALKFISFSQFKNQLDYADAGTALNSKVKSDVLSKVDAKSLVGKKIDFEGAFSLLTPSSVLIVPTQLKVSA